MKKEHFIRLTPLALAIAMASVSPLGYANNAPDPQPTVAKLKSFLSSSVSLAPLFSFEYGTYSLTLQNAAATTKDAKSPFANERINTPVLENSNITVEWSLTSRGWVARFPLGVPPETTLTITLDKVALKPGFQLKDTKLVVKTPPAQVANVYTESVVNPNAEGQNYVITNVETTLSVPITQRAHFEKAFTVEGLPLPKAVWDKAGKHLQLVQTLPLHFGSKQLQYANPNDVNWYDRDAQRALRGFKTPSEMNLLGLSGYDIDRVFTSVDKTALEWPLMTAVMVPENVWRTHGKLYKLPKKFNPNVALNTNWTLMEKITPEVIAKSTSIPFNVRMDSSSPLQARLIIDDSLVEPEDYLVYVMEKPMAPYSASTWVAPQWVKQVPGIKKQLHILEPGELVTMSEDHLLHLFHYGFDSVNVKVEHLRDPFLAQQSHVLIFDEVTNTQNSTVTTNTLHFAKTDAVNPISFKSVGIDKPGVYRITFTAKDGNDTLTEARSVLVSNMGVVAKQKATTTDGVVDVFVLDLVKNSPVTSAQVEVLAQNGTVLATGSIQSGSAQLKLPTIKNVNMSPALVRVKNGDDTAVVSLASYTMDMPAWKAYIYPERNRFLPQDTIHAGVILKSVGNHTGEAPLSWQVTDPYDKVVFRAPIEKGSMMSDMTYPLPASARLGDYRVSVMVGDIALAETVVNVNHFVPETLSVEIDPLTPEKRLWVRPQNLTLKGKVKALSDVNLGQLQGSAAFNYSNFASFTVPQHPTFTLMEPLESEKQKPSQELAIATKADGSFAVTVPSGNLLNGHISASIQFREPTGGASTVKTTGVNVLDRDYLMSYALGNANMNFDWLPPNTELPITFFAFDALGKAYKGAKFHVNLYRTWSEPVLEMVNDVPQRDVRTRQTQLSSTTLETGLDGQANWTLPKLGDDTYRLEIEDDAGNVLWRQKLNVVDENINRLLEGNTRLVTISMTPEKTVLSSGDTLKLNVRSPFAGLGLVTLDFDDVVKHEWVKLVPGSQVLGIKVPHQAGRMQVSLNAVRDFDDRNSLWSNYAFESSVITVNPKEHELSLKMEAPTTTYDRRVKVRITSPENARIQVWGVDQGILQVGNFSLPSSVNALYLDPKSYPSQHALLDHLMSQGLVGKTLGKFGGDMVRMALASNMVSPILRKPAVYWHKQFVDLKANVPQDVELVMPESFDGAMRVFAVGANQEKTGQVEALVALQSPVTALWSLPEFVRTGDSFESDLLLVSDASRPKTTLTISSTPGITMTPATRTLDLAKATPHTVSTRMTVTGDKNVNLDYTLKSQDYTRTGTGFLRVLPRQDGVTVEELGFIKSGQQFISTQNNLIAVGTTPAAFALDILPMMRTMKDWSLSGRLGYITTVARASQIEGLTAQILPNVENPLLEAQKLWQDTLATLKREIDEYTWRQRVDNYPRGFQNDRITNEDWLTMLELALSPLSSQLGSVNQATMDMLVKAVRDIPNPSDDQLLRSFVLMVKAGYTPYEPIYRFMSNAKTPDYAKRISQYLLDFMDGKVTSSTLPSTLASLTPSTNLDRIRLMLSLGSNVGDVVNFMKAKNLQAPTDVWGLLMMTPTEVAKVVDGASISNSELLIKSPTLLLAKSTGPTTVSAPGPRFMSMKGQSTVLSYSGKKIDVSTDKTNNIAEVGALMNVKAVFRPEANRITLLEVPLPGGVMLEPHSVDVNLCEDEACTKITNSPWDEPAKLAWSDASNVYAMVFNNSNQPFALSFKMRLSTPGSFAWPSAVLIDPMSRAVLDANKGTQIRVNPKR